MERPACTGSRSGRGTSAGTTAGQGARTATPPLSHPHRQGGLQVVVGHHVGAQCQDVQERRHRSAAPPLGHGAGVPTGSETKASTPPEGGRCRGSGARDSRWWRLNRGQSARDAPLRRARFSSRHVSDTDKTNPLRRCKFVKYRNPRLLHKTATFSQ